MRGEKMNLEKELLGYRAEMLESQLKEAVKSLDLATSKGWVPLNKWIAAGKPEAEWVDCHEYNKIREASSAKQDKKRAEREGREMERKKRKLERKAKKAKQELTDEISLLKNIIKNGLTIQDYLASKEKELDLIEQLDK